MLRKWISVMLSLTCALSLSACWDHTEITSMLIVAGIGLDVDDSGKIYHAVVEVINVEEEGGENITAKLVEGSGSSIYAAIQDAMVMTGGTLYTNHCKVVVIGDKLARQGIDVIIDLVLRSPNLRKTLGVLVAKDVTARSILTQKTVKNDIVSFELSKMLTSNEVTLNNTRTTGIYQLHEAFISVCPSAVAPVVSVKDNNGEQVLYIEGLSVFWDQRCLGYLDGSRSEAYNLASHTVNTGSIILLDPALSAQPFGVNILQSKAGYTPHIQGDRLVMQVNIQVDATLQGGALLQVDLSDENAVNQLEVSLERKLEADVKNLIAHVQSEYGADIFNFYKEFENRYRREWEGLSQDWQSHFKNLEVEVTADVVLGGSGLIENYAPHGEAANALP